MRCPSGTLRDMSFESTDSVDPESSQTAAVEASSRNGGVILAKRLTIPERKALRRCEKIIVKGAAEFIRVGLALREIRDHKLYRETHSTFEDYCVAKFDFRRAHGYRG